MFPLWYTFTLSGVFWSFTIPLSKAFDLYFECLLQVWEIFYRFPPEGREEKTTWNDSWCQWKGTDKERHRVLKSTETSPEFNLVKNLPHPHSNLPVSSTGGGGGDQAPGTEALGNFLCLLQSWLQNTGGRCLSSSFRDIMSWIELYKSSSHCDSFPQNMYFWVWVKR